MIIFDMNSLLAESTSFKLSIYVLPIVLSSLEIPQRGSANELMDICAWLNPFEFVRLTFVKTLKTDFELGRLPSLLKTVTKTQVYILNFEMTDRGSENR